MAHPEVLYSLHLDDGDDDLRHDNDGASRGSSIISIGDDEDLPDHDDGVDENHLESNDDDD